MAVTATARLVVMARSGGKCELCGVRIIEDDRIIGEIAHIRGDKPGSARYDKNMSENERNSPENLILLCPTCHTRVDKHPEKYTAKHLRDMRQRHLNELARTVVRAMPDIEYPELDKVVRYIAAIDIPLEDSYTLVPLEKKIQKNRLSRKWVKTGLSQASTVSMYMDRHSDAESRRLIRASFVKRYMELRDEGLDGDDLFMVLWQFASRHEVDPKIQVAGLALLVYLFEKCEVFEK